MTKFNHRHQHQMLRMVATAIGIIFFLNSFSSSSSSYFAQTRIGVEAAFASATTTSTVTKTSSIHYNKPIKIGDKSISSSQTFKKIRHTTSQFPNALHPTTTTTTTSTTKFRGGALASTPPIPLFDNTPFYQSTIIFTLINILGFLVSILSKGSHVHLDLLGTGAFTIAALPNLVQTSNDVTSRVFVSSASVMIWGIKLASFLFWRALNVNNRDARLEDLLSTVSGTAGFWFISAAWGIITSLPHTLGTTSSSPGNTPCLIIGTILYTCGLTIESLADYQKYTFKQSNPTSFCNVGLWSVSQHPNFFGNLLLWFGILIMNAPSLIGSVSINESGGGGILEFIKSNWRLPVACLSPLFLWSLFSSQVNGEMGNSVELANKKYGNDPGYMDYIENVPKIIPNLFLLWKK